MNMVAADYSRANYFVKWQGIGAAVDSVRLLASTSRFAAEKASRLCESVVQTPKLRDTPGQAVPVIAPSRTSISRRVGLGSNPGVDFVVAKWRFSDTGSRPTGIPPTERVAILTTTHLKGTGTASSSAPY